MQSIVITGFWLIGRQIGIEVSAKYYFVFFPLTWALGAIPISVGGAVVVEGGLVSLFTVVAGVEAEKALAIALCQRVVWMVAALPGAFVHLAGRINLRIEDLKNLLLLCFSFYFHGEQFLVADIGTDWGQGLPGN